MRLDNIKRAAELTKQIEKLIEDNDSAPYLTSFLTAVSVELNRQIAQFEAYTTTKQKQEDETVYKQGLYGVTDPVSGKMTMPDDNEMSKSMEQIVTERLTDKQSQVLSDSLPIPDYKLDFPDGQCLDC